jgi:hypothetical protein
LPGKVSGDQLLFLFGYLLIDISEFVVGIYRNNGIFCRKIKESSLNTEINPLRTHRSTDGNTYGQRLFQKLRAIYVGVNSKMVGVSNIAWNLELSQTFYSV